MSDEDNIVIASTYRLAAVSFWQSAKILYENRILTKGGHTSLTTVSPFYYLVSHACELFLKSALLKRGVTESDLKRQNVRHSLENLLKILESKDVDVSDTTKLVLLSLNGAHEKHDLRYNLLVSCNAFRLEASDIYSALEELLMTTRLRRD